MGECAPVALRPLRLRVEGARQETASKGRPRDSAHAEELQRGEHLALLLAVDEAVVVLHRDKRRQVVRERVVCTTALETGGQSRFYTPPLTLHLLD